MRSPGAPSGVLAGVLACVVALGGCSADEPADRAASTTASVIRGPGVPGSGVPGSNVQPESALPRVADIRPAIDALEAELGSPQRFFEVNATPSLVNLFVALNNATVVQPYTYLDGELAAGPAQTGAQGSTFPGSSVEFAAPTIFDDVRRSLRASTIEALEIIGGPDGAIRLTAIIRSPTGAQLLAVLDRDGSTLSVDSPEAPTAATGG